MSGRVSTEASVLVMQEAAHAIIDDTDLEERVKTEIDAIRDVLKKGPSRGIIDCGDCLDIDGVRLNIAPA